MSQSLGIAALVLNFASFVASVVGTAIPFWHYASVNGAKTSMGLWQMCISLQGHSQCASFILGKYSFMYIVSVCPLIISR